MTTQDHFISGPAVCVFTVVRAPQPAGPLTVWLPQRIQFRARGLRDTVGAAMMTRIPTEGPETSVCVESAGHP